MSETSTMLRISDFEKNWKVFVEIICINMSFSRFCCNSLTVVGKWNRYVSIDFGNCGSTSVVVSLLCFLGCTIFSASNVRWIFTSVLCQNFLPVIYRLFLLHRWLDDLNEFCQWNALLQVVKSFFKSWIWSSLNLNLFSIVEF